MYEYHAKLDRVVDGDTWYLWVDLGLETWVKTNFRLYGADTPEIYGPNATEEGTEVSQYVEKLLKAQGERFVIKTMKDSKGKYGRYIADIVIEHDIEEDDSLEFPTMLSDLLIKRGKAEKYEY